MSSPRNRFHWGLLALGFFNLLGGLFQNAAAADQPKLILEERSGTWTVEGHVKLSGKHLRIDGELILPASATLELDHCLVEMVGQQAREHPITWTGGTLKTRDTTIGGCVLEGRVVPTVFHLYDGTWEATDTIVQYSYGVSFSDKGVGVLRGLRLNAGKQPDSIIASDRADIRLEDSSFPLALGVYCDAGGQAVLDLPVNEPLSRVYDGTNLPGVRYRLELVDHTVPGLWFLFLRQISMQAPRCELTLKRCPSLIVSLLGHNLKGEIGLPNDLNSPASLGNLTIRKSSETAPVSVNCWGLYFSGEETAMTVKGPGVICELMQWGGQVNLEGTPGTHDLVLTCTTLDLKGTAALAATRVRLGRPKQWTPDQTIGEVHVFEKARLRGQDVELGRLALRTRDDGTIVLKAAKRTDQVNEQAQGGPITVEPGSCNDQNANSLKADSSELAQFD